MNTPLKTIRDNLNLTQEDLSNTLNIPIKTIRNWEQNIRKPSEWTLDLIIDRILRERLESTDESQGVISYLSIKKTVNDIAKKHDINRIYLFGSYIKGNATSNSDIDFYMESDMYGLDYFAFIEILREAFHKKIELLSNKTIEKSSKIEEEIKKTGVLIYERESLR